MQAQQIYYLCFSYYWYTYISNRVNNVNCEFRFFLLSMTLSPNYKDYGIWNRLALSSLLTRPLGLL